MTVMKSAWIFIGLPIWQIMSYLFSLVLFLAIHADALTHSLNDSIRIREDPIQAEDHILRSEINSAIILLNKVAGEARTGNRGPAYISARAKPDQLRDLKNDMKDRELERAALRRKLSIMTIGLLSIILILIIIGYVQKRKDNKLLSRQKESILEINRELEEKNAEIAFQRDEIQKSFEELEKTLDKLRKAQRKLIESEKMASLGQLTAGIAHEINNPINFVSANISPLKTGIAELRQVLDAYREAASGDMDQNRISNARELGKKYDLDYLITELDQLLNGISEGANRTKEIVSGLKNFSRLNEQELRRADIHEGIESTLILLRNQYRDRITITRDYDKDLEVIECYPGLLNQVFMNILTNAIQSIEDKGHILIKTRKSRTKAIIWIEDSGRGIPGKYLNKIFDPFFTTKDVGEGTGLGLSISYGIIQKHKGNIRVRSKVDQGTVFKISLPVLHHQ